MAFLDPSNFSLALCKSIGANSSALASLAARRSISALDKISLGGFAVLQPLFSNANRTTKEAMIHARNDFVRGCIRSSLGSEIVFMNFPPVKPIKVVFQAVIRSRDRDASQACAFAID
jgi:hypothetical protein